MFIKRMTQRILLAAFLLVPFSSFAHIIQITPVIPFPSKVSVFSPPITASYVVTNVSTQATFTAIDKSQLPSGLTITANSCGNSLAPKQSCTIQLTLTIGTATTISTYLREWAKPTADGMQYPINVEVIAAQSGWLFAGVENGSVYVSANNGAGWAPTTTTPNNGNAVNCVYSVNNTLYACSGNNLFYTTNGSAWTQTASPDNSLINALAVSGNTLIAATANGNIYFSTNNGLTWTVALSSPDGSSVTAVSTTGNEIIVGTDNGNVYYSTDSGASWTAVTSPDGATVTNVFAVGNTLYAGTTNQYIYSNVGLSTWKLYAQTVATLFVNADGSVIDGGTSNGYVYSLISGLKLGFVTASPIHSLFQLS